MRVKIKCKDTTTPIYYDNVASHFVEGPTLALLFEDGKVRNFPLIHIWYYETEQPREKTRTPSDNEGLQTKLEDWENFIMRKARRYNDEGC